MITASFRHIRGIGGMRERQLWLAGVRSWDELPQGDVLSPRLDGRLREGVAESRERLLAGAFDWFAGLLPQTEHWRLLPQVIEHAACLDIECTDSGAVSVIGVLDREGLRSYRGGRDLEEFVERARGWRALITFNGASFDLPILARTFPAFRPPCVHVDLKHMFQRLRERGGLKEIEPRMGMYRPDHLARLTGLDAVALWHAQARGEPAALRRLLEYNLYDVFHLRPLAELAYNRVVKRCGMPAAALPVSDRGAFLYDVSKAVEAALA